MMVMIVWWCKYISQLFEMKYSTEEKMVWSDKEGNKELNEPVKKPRAEINNVGKGRPAQPEALTNIR